ncbi:MAG TPA: DUF2637 domain-containing protein [Streptosporangiaceae bacterium]|nr:DUF2637 domain-containing protein [Streptosporangiaceae bacterium]
MSEQLPAQPALSAEPPRALRVIGLFAVCAGVAALAGAAFVLSYSGIHALALQAGVRGTLARGYPLILDVLLVVTLAAVLALRGAGWPSRLLAWGSLLALLAAAAGGDALHASGHRLPTRSTAVTAAILPWVLVLIAFALLLAMLRHARLRRSAAGARAQTPPGMAADAGPRPQIPSPPSTQPLVPGFPARPAGPNGQHEAPPLVVPRQMTPDVAADSREDLPDLAADAEDPGSPSRDEAGEPEPSDGADAEASTEETDPETEMPVFHRMWSAPVPPATDAD